MSSRAAAVGEAFACSSPAYGTNPQNHTELRRPRKIVPPSHHPSLSLVRTSILDLSNSLAKENVYSDLTRHRLPTSQHSLVVTDVTVLHHLIAGYLIARMETLTTHPSTAQQATAFTSPASLSFPGGAGELTPPSEKDGNLQANGASGAHQNGQQQQKGVDAASNGNGVTPTTPAATPGAGQGVSGLGELLAS